MSLQDLQNDSDDQAARWLALSKRVETLSADLRQLRERGEKLPAAADQCREQVVQTLDDLTAFLPVQLDLAEQTLGSLTTLPQSMASAFTAMQTATGDALSDLADTAEKLATSLGNDSQKALEATLETARQEFDELKGFVEEDFVATLSQAYEEQVEKVCETCAELRDSVEEHVDEWVETAMEQVEELTQQMDEFGQKWTESVTEVKDAYEGLVEKVVTLGEDITTLTEAIDTALNTTGIGMNAATDSMNDILAIMGGVA